MGLGSFKNTLLRVLWWIEAMRTYSKYAYHPIRMYMDVCSVAPGNLQSDNLLMNSNSMHSVGYMRLHTSSLVLPRSSPAVGKNPGSRTSPTTVRSLFSVIVDAEQLLTFGVLLVGAYREFRRRWGPYLIKMNGSGVHSNANRAITTRLASFHSILLLR